MPLLRPVRARLRDALLFQLGVHHRRRRAEDREVHADPERDGLEGADRSRRRTRRRGILYIDRNTREAKEVHARAVVLCAQALESARILLNSATREYPNGLANSSGALGHYLMDHHRWQARYGGFPDLPPDKPSEGRSEPAERDLCDPLPQHEDRPAAEGLHPRLRVPGWRRQPVQLRCAGYGAAYKKAMPTQPQSSVYLGGFGETPGEFENFVEIDPSAPSTRSGFRC